MPQTIEARPQNLKIDLSVLTAEPADEYHAKKGEYLSSHQLLDFIACPWLYRKKQLGLIDDVDTQALLIGRATHCRILEGAEAFEQQFALGGPFNPRTDKPFGKDTNAFRDWSRDLGKPGVHYDDLAGIENMASGVAMNDEAVELLQYGRGEGVVRTDYCETPCQIRIDWLHPRKGIVDLKTARDLDRFEFDAKQRRYHHQLAFYQAVLAEVVGVLAPVYLIAVEKIEPFRCGVWRLSDETLATARRENETAIRRLRRAWEVDHFPTGYEVVRVLDF